MKLKLILSFIFLTLILPSSLFAWGGLTHIYLSSQILFPSAATGLVLGKSILTLLKKYPCAFYYGSISPDFIIAKRLVPYRYHTHNWKTALKFFQAAETEKEKAFAYGFLSHLAADTVAHNYFSPYKLMVENTSKNFGHAYWELRADALVENKVQEIFKQYNFKNNPALDEFMKKTLEQYPFSLELNIKIFLQLLKIGHRFSKLFNLPLVKTFSRYVLPGEELEFLLYSSLRNITDILNNPESSFVLMLNPAGIGIDKQIKKIHKTIRKMVKKGILKGREDYERAFRLIYSDNLTSFPKDGEKTNI